MATEERKTVIVLGAPRSGTSMTAGILTVLGVSMGKIRPPDALNPSGYFEDWRFLSIADDILTAAMPGAHGFNLPSTDALQSVHGQFNKRIQDLIRQRTDECTGEMWGWKAVGTSLFADEFLPFVSNPHVVVVLRNPVRVARSVTRYVRHEDKRQMYEALSMPEALQVINQYEAGIYGFLRRHPDTPQLILAYEAMVADPKSVVRTLSSFLGIAPSRRMYRQVDAFVGSRRPPGRRRWPRRLARAGSRVQRLATQRQAKSGAHKGSF